MYRYILILSALVVTSIALTGGREDEPKYHDPVELDRYFKFMMQDTSLITGRNDLFAASGECEGCHGYDPAEIASLNAAGEDINVVDDWRATIMANSSKDPFWKAKVSHESLVSPDILNELESSCTDCHAPLGFYNAMHLGMPHYTMEDLRLDSVALDGVSCGACHQISPDGVGQTFSGIDINYEEGVIYGQYPDPFAGPMQSFVGFQPVYSTHIEESEVCATCHTLITETVGLDGQFNGNHFVEQATYHEWLNSSYSADGEGAIECQGCHMTRVDDEVVIANNLLFLPARTPFYRHDIVGGNTFMLDMMKDNIDTLDIRADAEDFDEVKAATLELLQENTLDMDIIPLSRSADTLYFDVELTNKAGHKFPSGYPSRIAYIEVVARDEAGNVLFESGLLDESYELIGRDIPYEQHYDHITSEQQVQVYELVLADESGAETTVLSHAEFALKDNRLAPFGFSDTHQSYDTTAYFGEVLNDDDFNLDGAGVQGTGKDRVSYHIPTGGVEGEIEVEVAVYYQVTPPRWLASMFEFSSEDIDLFRWMYDNADKEPVAVASGAFTSNSVGLDEEIERQDLVLFPNPTLTDEVRLHNRSSRSIDEITLYDSNAKLLYSRGVRGNTVSVNLPLGPGVYFLIARSNGEEHFFRVLRL